MNKTMLKGMAIPALAMLILGMMIVPLSPTILDILFVVNICVSLTVLMTSILSKKPLEFSSFPTVLLVSTMMRLSLNVASSRVILMHGHDGGDATGMVIKAFGDFAIGGNYVVGIIVFAILSIINLIVVVKGTERVSEVGARFTLDAMPGKQMSIDADLASGTIDQGVASGKRSELSQESQFFGAMDGASKFVKGDSIAGMLILAINIIGGISIGVAQQGMSLTDALSCYTVLSIGDGLVAIVPSIIMSLATAVVITKINDEQDLTSTITSQLFRNINALRNAGIVVMCIGLIPAMPNILFLSVAAIILGYSYYLSKSESIADTVDASNLESEQEDSQNFKKKAAIEVSIDDVREFDTVTLEFGSGLSEMFYSESADVIRAVDGVRKTLTTEYGVMVSGVCYSANNELESNSYVIKIKGVEVARGQVYAGLYFAMDYDGNLPRLNMGVEYVEPVDLISGFWIMESQIAEAEVLGYEVFKSEIVLSNHIGYVLEHNLSEMVDLDSVDVLVDRVSRVKPKLVSSVLVNDNVQILLYAVIKDLLRERAPVNQMSTILESFAMLQGYSNQTQDMYLKFVRIKISKWILRLAKEKFGVDESEELLMVSLSHKLSDMLMQTAMATESLALDLETKKKLIDSVVEKSQLLAEMGQPMILLAPQAVRKELFDLVSASVPDIYVMCYEEIPFDMKVKVVATI
ncbi:flagellar biosynthesis protein FlhA [Photobacterium damselae]|uniref:flagellar biosynthesis protein FlhA n=1 Tax=Photobacterium damselae TaxID=38293 RepID=UPI001F2B7DAB|nr:flagellar biosynthesis protein FlhA [Photobacterium damselae]UKA04610.1 flagellar biosynthesis protein FlhA [Photobacterium damselae subsp. damselae]